MINVLYTWLINLSTVAAHRWRSPNFVIIPRHAAESTSIARHCHEECTNEMQPSTTSTWLGLRSVYIRLFRPAVGLQVDGVSEFRKRVSCLSESRRKNMSTQRSLPSADNRSDNQKKPALTRVQKPTSARFLVSRDFDL